MESGFFKGLASIHTHFNFGKNGPLTRVFLCSCKNPSFRALAVHWLAAKPILYMSMQK